VYVGTPLGVFKSTDAGASWVAKNSGLTAMVAGAVTVDPSSPATVFASAVGVFKSTDGGATGWIPTSTGLEQEGSVSAFAVDRQAPGVVYAATSSSISDGVFKSCHPRFRSTSRASFPISGVGASRRASTCCSCW
jgi:hypothetical protein